MNTYWTEATWFTWLSIQHL